MTAADHAQLMYGVEYQANAVQALLWEDYKAEVGDSVQLALLFVLLLVALSCFWRRPVKWAAFLWAALCGGWVVLVSGGKLYPGRSGTPKCDTDFPAVCCAGNRIRADGLQFRCPEAGRKKV